MTWEMNYDLDICHFCPPNIKGIFRDPNEKIFNKKKQTCFCFADVNISASQHEIFYHCAMFKNKKMKQFGKRKEKKEEQKRLRERLRCILN